MDTVRKNSWDKDYENTDLSPVYDPLWEMLQSFLERVPAGRVLDFGCGDGPYACLIADQGFKVAGIDISNVAINKAASRGCRHCSFVRHDSIPHDWQEDSFDLVVMLNSLHCLDDNQRQKLFGQVRRVLKPHGHFFASALSLADESYPRHEWQNLNPGTFVDEAGRLFHFFSVQELEGELSWLDIQEIKVLENIHPQCGRKSSLFVVMAQLTEGLTGC